MAKNSKVKDENHVDSRGVMRLKVMLEHKEFSRSDPVRVDRSTDPHE